MRKYFLNNPTNLVLSSCGKFNPHMEMSSLSSSSLSSSSSVAPSGCAKVEIEKMVEKITIMGDDELKVVAQAAEELAQRCVQETNYRQMVGQQQSKLKFIEGMKPTTAFGDSKLLELKNHHLVIAWQLVEAMNYAMADEKTRDIACVTIQVDQDDGKNGDDQVVEVINSRKNIWARFLRRILAQPGVIDIGGELNVKILGTTKDKKSRAAINKKITYFEERGENHCCFDATGGGMRFWYTETLCDTIWMKPKNRYHDVLYERGAGAGASQIESLAQDLGINLSPSYNESKESELMSLIFYYGISSSLQKLNLFEWIQYCINVRSNANGYIIPDDELRDRDGDDW